MIGFDARMIHHSGIGSHIRGLMHGFSHLRQQGVEVPRFLFVGDRGKLSQNPNISMLGEMHEFKAPIYSLREQILYPDLPVNLMHFPHYNVPLKCGMPYVVTIHDLIHLLFPEFVGSKVRWLVGKQLLRHATHRARLIVTGSEWTRRDLMEKLELPEERIRIVPSAASADFQPQSPTTIENVRSILDLPTRYLLAVGINKPHKNYPFLIRAFGAWRRKSGADLHLVICGIQQEDIEQLGACAAAAGVSDALHLLTYVSQELLPSVYQAADALVFPSLYEGFGIPVLEAQRMSVPVICSHASSLPEVAGHGALYFDPRSESEFVARLDELHGNALLRDRLISDGQANENRYSWTSSATALLDVYASVSE